MIPLNLATSTLSTRPLVIILLIHSLVLVGESRASRQTFHRLRAISERNNTFSTISYDELHRLAVLDQIESYIEPIKWLDTRHCKPLNGLYEFCFDPQGDGFRQDWASWPLIDSCGEGNYHKMPVPAAFNEILSNKTAKNYMGWMWYQTTWVLDWRVQDEHSPQLDDSLWLLQIDSINYLSLVWIHSSGVTQFVGSHVGGHLPVTLNISSFMKDLRAESDEVLLTFAVSNLLTSETIPSGRMVDLTKQVGRPYFEFKPDFDFFHFAGIMGNVNTIKLPKYYIDQIRLVKFGVERPHRLMVCLNTEHASRHDVKLRNLASNGHEIGSTLEGYCGEMSSLRCICFRLWIAKEQGGQEMLDRYLEWPHKHQLLRPLRLRVELKLDGNDSATPKAAAHDRVVVRLSQQVDMGRIESAKQLQGFGMHHEQMFSGRTMSLASIMKDLQLVKSMGANVIRTSHYPYSAAYLDACDELGVMVIAECPAVGLNSFSRNKLLLHKQIVLEMVARDKHHPSILMWSLANEPESQLPEAREYFSNLTDWVRSNITRGSRPLTAAIAQSHVDDKIGHLFDVLMINRYYGWYDCTGQLECVNHSLWTSLTGWAYKYGRPLIISEFGADTVAGLHSQTSEIFSEEYQRDLIVEHERVFDRLAASESVNFIGSMVWNFADFSTHESLFRVGGNKKGVVTRAREPKLAAQSLKEIYLSRSEQPTRAGRGQGGYKS